MAVYFNLVSDRRVVTTVVYSHLENALLRYTTFHLPMLPVCLESFLFRVLLTDRVSHRLLYNQILTHNHVMFAAHGDEDVRRLFVIIETVDDIYWELCPFN